MTREPHPDLFRVERNYKRAGTSSQAAALAAKSARVGELHEKIWHALRLAPGTPDEVARRLGMVLNTARARCTDLRNLGLAEPTGEKRRTAAGRLAEVLRAVEKRGLFP